MARKALAQPTEPMPADAVPAQPRKSRPLFEIIPELRECLLAVEANGGELDGPTGTALEKWLNSLGDEIGKKLDGYIAVIRNAEIDAASAKVQGDCYKKEAEFFYGHTRTFENTANRLKGAVKDWMTLTEQKEILTASGRRIVVQDNGGADTIDAATVDLNDLELVDYIKLEPTLDTDKVLLAMKTGKKFTNVRTVPKGTHLRIY